MNVCSKVALVVALGLLGATGYAQDEKLKKAEGHCEKTDKDGKVSDIEAASKADCKTKGGKWHKGAKHDEHK